MRKIAHYLAVLLIILLGLIGVAALVSTAVAGSRLNQTYEITPENIEIPTDPAAVARGAYLAGAICSDCHGGDLSGGKMVDEPGMATVYAPNITPSETGVGDFSDADYVRAIRHGVDPQGRGLMIMPAEVFINWSAQDLGAIIAYLKSLPPNDNSTPPRSLGALGRILFAAGMMGDVMPAEYIDHAQPFPAMPPIGETAEYGAYMTQLYFCTGCHGQDMRGGVQPHSDPDMGPVPSAVDAANWSQDEFITALTTGVKPDGSLFDNERMPWQSIARLNHEDLTAVYLYLQQLAGK
jgi:mono/diheme cytochrome c family protein